MKHETKHRIINFIKRLLKYKEREFPVFDRQDYQVEKIQVVQHLEDLEDFIYNKKSYQLAINKLIFDEIEKKDIIKIVATQDPLYLRVEAELLVCI